MAESLLTGCWLLAASTLDIRSRRVPVWMLVLGGAFAGLTVVHRCGFTLVEWVEMVKGCIPGAILLILAAATGKAGAADGIVLSFLGICMGGKVCLAVFMLRRVGRNTRLPYLPFLSAAWLLVKTLQL